MDRLEKELKRIQQRTSEMIRNLTSCHRNTFDNSVSSRPFYPSFHQFTQTLSRIVPTRPDLSQLFPTRADLSQLEPTCPNSTRVDLNGPVRPRMDPKLHHASTLATIFQPMKKPRSRPQTANTCLNRERTATPTLTKRSSSALNGSSKPEQTFEILRPRQCLLKLTLLTHLE